MDKDKGTTETDVQNPIKAQLLAQVTQKALMSALANAVPIPGVDITIDYMLMTEAMREYMKKFKIDETSLQHFADLYDIRYTDLLNQLEFSREIAYGKIGIKEFIVMIIKERSKTTTTKTFAKYVPIVGSLVSAGISYGFTEYVLRDLIEKCDNDSKRLSSYINEILSERERRRNCGCFWWIRRR